MRRKKTPSSRAVKIAFIGGGRMAEALIKGLSKSVSPEDIIASDVLAERRDYLKDNYGIGVTQNNQECADFGDIIIVSVKPHIVKEGVRKLKIQKSKVLISIAAGIPISLYESIFPDNPVIRVMPNNPALVREGLTALAYGEKAKAEDKDKAKAIFKTVGEIVEIPENLMDAVTGLSGSGPAFVYLFVEAMIDAGKSLSVDKETAYRMAVQTVMGAAETLRQTKKSTEELINMVTSPGGTTLAGLKVLDEKGFKQIVSDAIIAAAKRAKELSKEWT